MHAAQRRAVEQMTPALVELARMIEGAHQLAEGDPAVTALLSCADATLTDVCELWAIVADPSDPADALASLDVGPGVGQLDVLGFDADGLEIRPSGAVGRWTHDGSGAPPAGVVVDPDRGVWVPGDELTPGEVVE